MTRYKISPKVEKPSDPDQQVAAAKSQRQVHRSPSYPFISLEKAIERARVMHSKDGRHAAPFSAVAEHWGYQAKSSGALQTVAALRQFGLVSFEEGNGAERMVKLTDLAIRILLDQRPDEKRKAIQRAALSPKLYADLWSKWGANPPSDPVALSHLTVDLEFNHATAPQVLSAYRDTLAFACLQDDATISDESEDNEDESDEEPEEMEASVGLPEKPAKPVPVAQLHGEKEHLRLTLAGDRSVRVLFSGPAPTRAEIETLITILTATKGQYPEAQ